ncbi:MAG: SUF system Fe-S cluster assembly regulator [Alphaproteobacteria bacterium]|nr:SUF system Fe-S cluster assembly regulator [Alphaproteobacteria bacterium]
MSKLADYSFIVMAQMARQPQTLWSVTALAEATTLPVPTVAKLMKRLAQNALVRAQRGAMGGYVLAYAPHAVSLAVILEAIDGPISLTACANSNERCHCAASWCAVRQNWGPINQTIRQYLNELYLADLAFERRMGEA